MSDLISRSALLAEYDKHHVGAPGMARKLIADAPTIDAVPVVHGRWMLVEYNETPFSADQALVCTVCGYAHVHDAWFNRCPNCGAKMDGEADV